MSAATLLPLDASVRDGRMKCIGNGDVFAVARWDAASERFLFSSGEPVGFEPTGYYQGGGRDG